MSLEQQINEGIKTSMKSKDAAALRSLRAIKAALLLEKTKEGAQDISEEDEIKILTKMAKQRRDSLELYEQQGREDLAVKEREELAIIEKFLPEQMGEEELSSKLSEIIERLGVKTPQEMGKVMGVAMKELAGKADGKLISATVRKLLN